MQPALGGLYALITRIIMTKLEKERFGVFGTAICVPDLHLIIKIKPRRVYRYRIDVFSISLLIGRNPEEESSCVVAESWPREGW